MYFSRLVPPIVYSLFCKFSSNPVIREEDISVFSSFEEAASVCGKYDDNVVADVVRIKTKLFLKNNQDVIDNRQATQNLLVFQTVINNSNNIEVVEIGGACGALYFFINNYFSKKIKMWRIFETPSMAQAGKKYFEDDRLIFSSALNDLSKNGSTGHICIASGVIQYLPNPSACLDLIFSNQFEYIYFTRQPVLTSHEAPVITTQITNLLDHGPGTLKGEKYNKKKKTPVTYIPEKYFFDRIDQYGYSIIYNFEEQSEMVLNFNGNPIQYKIAGLLLKRK